LFAELRKATIPIFFDMMSFEFSDLDITTGKIKGNFCQVIDEMISDVCKVIELLEMSNLYKFFKKDKIIAIKSKLIESNIEMSNCTQLEPYVKIQGIIELL
jgi:hypothetical protein